MRPHLEFANQVWSPRLKKHRTSIENVQRRAIRLIPGYKNVKDDKQYIEALRKLKLPTLAYRRLRGDLIEIYKILTLKYDEDVCCGLLTRCEESTTRGHRLRVFKERCRLEVRRLGFPHRAIDTWNNLPSSVVDAPKTHIFEHRLDKFLSEKKLYYDFEADINNRVECHCEKDHCSQHRKGTASH